jgi:hypothetical protein
MDYLAYSLIKKADLEKRTEAVIDFFSRYPKLFFFNRESLQLRSSVNVILDECVPFGEITILRLSIAMIALLDKYPIDGLQAPMIYSLDRHQVKVFKNLAKKKEKARFNTKELSWVYNDYRKYAKNGTQSDLYRLLELDVSYYTTPTHYSP